MHHKPRVIAVALVALVAATVGMASAARAEPPPDAEPSLFVVHAPVRHDDGVLSVRTGELEWFADRPNRDAGSLTTEEFVERWDGWGFGSDPPNAALSGDDADVIGELSAPRVRGRALRFDFAPFRGEVPDGKLGTVSLLIDPTEPTPAEVPTAFWTDLTNGSGGAMTFRQADAPVCGSPTPSEGRIERDGVLRIRWDPVRCRGGQYVYTFELHSDPDRGPVTMQLMRLGDETRAALYLYCEPSTACDNAPGQLLNPLAITFRG